MKIRKLCVLKVQKNKHARCFVKKLFQSFFFDRNLYYNLQNLIYRDNPMTPSQKEQIKENIVEQIASLESEILELQEKIKPISPDCSLGDLTRFEMMHEQDVFHKALYNSQIRLGRLKHILVTIDGNDEYGSCIECGEEVLFERLLLLPESTQCIDCASNK